MGRQLQKYKKAEFIWCQEEPMNMGAWNTVKYYIDRTLEIIKIKGQKVKYIGRNAAASPGNRKFKQTPCRTKRNIRKGCR